MSAKGGITEGKSHAEGGIPMVVKSTGQNVELEGGEGVINKRNMASTKTFDFEGKKMTICEIASKINSADGNGVQIDCDNVTGTKYKYAEGGKILNEDEESEFKIWFEDGNVIEFEKDVYSTQDAQYRNRLKGMDELRKYFRKEFLSDNYQYSEGGNVNQELKMDYDFRSLLLPNEKQFFLQNNTKAIQHNNLFIFTDGKREIVFSRHKTKLKKLGNASKSTKELYDKYFADGGYVDLETYNFNELRGKYVYLYSMGVEFPEEYKIVDVTLTSPQFRYRDLTLKFDLGNAKIKFDDIEDFLHEEIVYVKTDKEEFGVQLIPNQFAKGGRTKNAMKTDDYENASLSMDSYEDGAISSNPTEFAKGGEVDNEEVYIEFLNKEKGFKKDIKHFNSYEEAVKWGRENFERFDSDMIKYKYAKGGFVVYAENEEGYYRKISEHDTMRGAKIKLNNVFDSGEYEKVGAISSEEWEKNYAPYQFKKGGEIDLPKADKMFHLPLELAVYVPSTQDVDKVISDSELKERVDEVSEYLARLFGGFTKSDKIGGFMSSKSELVTEDVVPVVSFATQSDFNANKNKLVTQLSLWAKKWGQEAIGFEFEGDLYYVPENFANGGNIKKIKYGNMTKHKYAEGGRVRYYLNGFEESLNYILNSTNGKEVRREGSKENGDLVIYFETTDEEYAQGGGIKHSYEITQEGNEFIVEFLKSNGELDWGRGGFSSREEAEKYALENRRYAKGGGVYRHKYVVQWLEDDNLNREYYYSDEYEEAKELYYQIKYDLGDSQYKKFGINIMDIETGEIVFGDEFEYAKGGGVDNKMRFYVATAHVNYFDEDGEYQKFYSRNHIKAESQEKAKMIFIRYIENQISRNEWDWAEDDIYIQPAQDSNETIELRGYLSASDFGGLTKDKFSEGRFANGGGVNVSPFHAMDRYNKIRHYMLSLGFEVDDIQPTDNSVGISNGWVTFTKQNDKTEALYEIDYDDLLYYISNNGTREDIFEDSSLVDEDEYAKGGGVSKFPIALKRNIDEINDLFVKVKSSDEVAGGYFGGTHYTYVQLKKPIEIKGNYVYIFGDKDRYNYSFEKRYNINKKGDEVDGLSALKYDLSNIKKAFKSVLKNQYAQGGITEDDAISLNYIALMNGIRKSENTFEQFKRKLTEVIKRNDYRMPTAKAFEIAYEKNQFADGGDVRDMSWYQDFKKQELKRGTEHEMEHIESIKKFKKKGVSDREVAKAIAKDHLDENENYYIELEKMQESSEKVSNALQDFEHQKSKRKSSRKYKLGGYMGDNKSVNVHIKLTKDHEAVVRSKDGTYLNDVNLKKDKVYKFGFLFDEGQNVAFDLGDSSDSYMLIPSNIVVVVGYDEEKMELGGEVKSYADYNLDRNDKSILKLLLNINPRNATAEQRDKVSTFKGNNIVNDLSPKLIQKIYGILFQNHNVDNKILNLYITNIGVGTILMYAPSYLHKTMVGFDEKNQFVQVEKEIANIVTEGKRVFLFNEFELSDMDGFIHVYPKSNPEVDTLCGIFYKTKKKAVALGVCEFTSREKLDAFQRSIGINQGSMALNQMISFAKSNDYLIVNEGITSEGAYTLIYTMTKY